MMDTWARPAEAAWLRGPPAPCPGGRFTCSPPAACPAQAPPTEARPSPPYASRQPTRPVSIPEELPEPTEGHSGPEVPSERGQLEAISGAPLTRENRRGPVRRTATSARGVLVAKGQHQCWSREGSPAGVTAMVVAVGGVGSVRRRP